MHWWFSIRIFQPLSYTIHNRWADIQQQRAILHVLQGIVSFAKRFLEPIKCIKSLSPVYNGEEFVTNVSAPTFRRNFWISKIFENCDDRRNRTIAKNHFPGHFQASYFSTGGFHICWIEWCIAFCVKFILYKVMESEHPFRESRTH